MSKHTSKLATLFLLAAPGPARRGSPTPDPAGAARPSRPPAAPGRSRLRWPQPTPRLRPRPAAPSPKSMGDVQVLLDRAASRPGSSTAAAARNTRKALAAFQAANGLPVDRQDRRRDLAEAAGGRRHQPGRGPLHDHPRGREGPVLPQIPEDMEDKAKLPPSATPRRWRCSREQFHATPEFLQKLNPRRGSRRAGEQHPGPQRPARPPTRRTRPQVPDGRRVVVSKSDCDLHRQAGATSSSSSPRSPRAASTTRCRSATGRSTASRRNPTFNYNPDLFWDAEPSDKKAKIPAGPNNPVGVVWIDLSKEHYGIHGTPEPKTIGKTDLPRLRPADQLGRDDRGRLVKAGTPVLFTE